MFMQYYLYIYKIVNIFIHCRLNCQKRQNELHFGLFLVFVFVHIAQQSFCNPGSYGLLVVNIQTLPEKKRQKRPQLSVFPSIKKHCAVGPFGHWNGAAQQPIPGTYPRCQQERPHLKGDFFEHTTKHTTIFLQSGGRYATFKAAARRRIPVVH